MLFGSGLHLYYSLVEKHKHFMLVVLLMNNSNFGTKQFLWICHIFLVFQTPPSSWDSKIALPRMSFLLLLTSAWHAVREHEIRVSLHFHVYSIFPPLQCAKGEGNKRFCATHNEGRGIVSAPPQTKSGALPCSRDLLTGLVTVCDSFLTAWKMLMEVHVCPT